MLLLKTELARRRGAEREALLVARGSDSTEGRRTFKRTNGIQNLSESQISGGQRGGGEVWQFRFDVRRVGALFRSGQSPKPGAVGPVGAAAPCPRGPSPVVHSVRAAFLTGSLGGLHLPGLEPE